jgi:hypothetical protein
MAASIPRAGAYYVVVPPAPPRALPSMLASHAGRHPSPADHGTARGPFRGHFSRMGGTGIRTSTNGGESAEGEDDVVVVGVDVAGYGGVALEDNSNGVDTHHTTKTANVARAITTADVTQAGMTVSSTSTSNPFFLLSRPEEMGFLLAPLCLCGFVYEGAHGGLGVDKVGTFTD